MIQKRLGAIWFIGLIVWNLLPGGGFLMCLHNAGAAHVVEITDPQECCHELEDDNAYNHVCNDCIDLKFQAIELITSRNESRPFPSPIVLDQAEYSSPWSAFQPFCLYADVTPRVPHYARFECLLVVKSIVFRI